LPLPLLRFRRRNMAGEDATGAAKTDSGPSFSFLPLFEVGRVPGKWYLAHGATLVHGETVGSIVGHITDMMSAIQSRLIMSEIVAAKRKGGVESETPGAQSREILTALEDAAADMQDAEEREETPRPAALDHLLEHPSGKQILRMLGDQYNNSDPTLGTENTFRGDRSVEFYEGMVTAFAAALGAKLALAKELRGKADVRALDLFQALVGRFAAGAMLRTQGVSNGSREGSTERGSAA
jgi:hypothetical protein